MFLWDNKHLQVQTLQPTKSKKKKGEKNLAKTKYPNSRTLSFVSTQPATDFPFRGLSF